jgi:hypothetical protein
MRRLTDRVNQLYGESGNDVVLFWLDTICFPVHSPAAADLALIAMRKTYADADRVLVLDRYLEAIASKPLLHTESLVRILCSSWTRRLWTLQEGALAKSLYFQFADEAIDIAQAAFLMTAEMTFVTTDRSLEYQPISSMVSELWEVWKPPPPPNCHEYCSIISPGGCDGTQRAWPRTRHYALQPWLDWTWTKS